MADCESTRGEWGKPCPDCGVRLPKRKPIMSWKAAKEERLGMMARDIANRRPKS